MTPIALGFVGTLVGFYIALKGERPALGLLLFASLGFMLGYGSGVGFTAYTLGGLSF